MTTQRQAQAPCSCITKEYQPDGSVVFTDNCAKEQAMATLDELRAQRARVFGQPQQAQNACTCYTKQYLAQGGVLFTDTCTGEQAMATPRELRAQRSAAYMDNNRVN